MLFGYPLAATSNNWLHECLCAAIRNVHEAADSGRRYPGWPRILPLAQQSKLRLRSGLRDRMRNYDHVIRGLSKSDRDYVLQAFEDQNRISDLLAGSIDCIKISGLPSVVREPIVALFDFAYYLLQDLGLRDPHYAAIYNSIPDHLCPFCGTEYFDAPGARREALDHYLTKSLYPFAAANLRNLVPMGHKCNSSYKLAIDILLRPDGTRRVAFDPYSHAEILILLDDSSPFHGISENTPNWEIQFYPDTPSVSTWDEVFKVRERYCRDHLNPSFSSWLRHFRHWAQASELVADSDEAIVAALQRYEKYWAESGMNDRAFLKAAVFRMLRRHCESGDQRLLKVIKDLVTPSAAPTAMAS